MKIVIVSDLHANFDAVSALPESYDELWVLGDLVNYGPQPSEVLEFVRAYATVVVRGNHDHAVGFNEDPRCSPRYHEMAEQTRQFTSAVLNAEQKRFLRDLPLSVEIERDGATFYLCHAVPSDPLYRYGRPDDALWAEELKSISADFLLVGHTHLPFVRTFGRHIVANPGSLGQPKTGSPEACYAVWKNGALGLKRFPYPVEQVISRLEALTIDEQVKRDLCAVLRTGTLAPDALRSAVVQYED
jgi:putative phosphoesterase